MFVCDGEFVVFEKRGSLFLVLFLLGLEDGKRVDVCGKGVCMVKVVFYSVSLVLDRISNRYLTFLVVVIFFVVCVKVLFLCLNLVLVRIGFK